MANYTKLTCITLAALTLSACTRVPADSVGPKHAPKYISSNEASEIYDTSKGELRKKRSSEKMNHRQVKPRPKLNRKGSGRR